MAAVVVVVAAVAFFAWRADKAEEARQARCVRVSRGFVQELANSWPGDGEVSILGPVVAVRDRESDLWFIRATIDTSGRGWRTFGAMWVSRDLENGRAAYPLDTSPSSRFAMQTVDGTLVTTEDEGARAVYACDV